MNRKRWRCRAWNRDDRDMHVRSCDCAGTGPDSAHAMGFVIPLLFGIEFKGSVVIKKDGERKTIEVGSGYKTKAEAESAVDSTLARLGKEHCPGLVTVAKTPEEAECRKQLRVRIRENILSEVKRRYADWRSYRAQAENTVRHGDWDPGILDRIASEPCITASDLVHSEEMDGIEDEFGVVGRNCMRYNERRMLVWTEAESLRKSKKLKSALGLNRRGREVRCYEPGVVD